MAIIGCWRVAQREGAGGGLAPLLAHCRVPPFERGRRFVPRMTWVVCLCDLSEQFMLLINVNLHQTTTN